MDKGYIHIQGARVHNLKNVSLKLPRNKLIVFTGLSGSGKSSLAFDTIYAEGQRRYIDSLSAYARQFLEQLQKPDCDNIEGMSPAISIEQKTAGSNPRSTVGTTTEIYDYLRVLFARIGTAYCYNCGKKIARQSSQEIVDQVLKMPAGTQISILAPKIAGRKGEYKELFKEIKKDGYTRVRVDGRIAELENEIKLDKDKKHSIEIVVDRLEVKPDSKRRLADSIETALKAGSGVLIVNDGRKDRFMSELYACVDCGISYEEPSPRSFSFNSPYGACPVCNGLGTKLEIDADLVIPDRSKPVMESIEAWKRGGRGYLLYYRGVLREVADRYHFDLDTPFDKLNKEIRKIILYGADIEVWGRKFEGVIPQLERLFRETESGFLKEEINKYMSVLPCPKCAGARLRPESLAFKIGGKPINEVTALSVKEARGFFTGLDLSEKEAMIARQSLKEILSRLKFMADVGLDYLTLDRASGTLSGGESQRIRLATQIGSGLVGVVYVLDEPSIGLHQRDNTKLLESLKALRDLGNTLIVVEHDEATIRSADYIVDLGPGAGKHGGKVVCAGPLEEFMKCKDSLTAKYLKKELKIEPKLARRDLKGRKSLEIKGAREHNLKDIDVTIPLGVFVCVTGVSGSGKSTLIDEILYRSLAQKFYRAKEKPGDFDRITGAENIDKVIVIDQSPIGRTPRSNPATYTGMFSPIRDLFSRLPEAKIRGYRPGRFSFNVKGGRCEACQGDGVIKVEMHFLPDVYVTCEVCKGARFNQQTLEVLYKGHSINDVLKMTVEDALPLFANIPRIREKLQVLNDVGLGYVELGQSATTLSGGEAQRVKLATELSKRSTGRTLYILDEPTTGLHFADVDKLLKVLHALTDQGNTVLVIEHNLDVVKTSDYIIDLGPEGGDEGGEVVAAGSPEDVAKNRKSYTGSYLGKLLSQKG
ncbi:MAG: excinuclease ABC subunit UvrA [Candidatus Omnitrophica bacterium]|nr:excinuclease ABC subunit UvrA [Candidatus Omnitrophota bacterium]MDD5545891.1 excinuclease ABC subunit UvrA [Candidatus Omnitrophota bacterium]